MLHKKTIVQFHEKTHLRRKIICESNKPVGYTFSMVSQRTLHEVSTTMSARQRTLVPHASKMDIPIRRHKIEKWLHIKYFLNKKYTVHNVRVWKIMREYVHTFHNDIYPSRYHLGCKYWSVNKISIGHYLCDKRTHIAGQIKGNKTRSLKAKSTYSVILIYALRPFSNFFFESIGSDF